LWLQKYNFLVIMQIFKNKKCFPKRKAFIIKVIFYKCALNFSAITSFGATPTNLSTTSPFLKIRTVGIFLIPYCIEIS